LCPPCLIQHKVAGNGRRRSGYAAKLLTVQTTPVETNAIMRYRPCHRGPGPGRARAAASRTRRRRSRRNATADPMRSRETAADGLAHGNLSRASDGATEPGLRRGSRRLPSLSPEPTGRDVAGSLRPREQATVSYGFGSVVVASAAGACAGAPELLIRRRRSSSDRLSSSSCVFLCCSSSTSGR
jgi:hypothetical protein